MTLQISLQEFGTSADVALTHRELAHLQATAGRALSFGPGGSPGFWRIRSSSVVGTVVTPTVHVLIRPKVANANLFHLLEPSSSLVGFDAASFDYLRADHVTLRCV